MKNIMNKLHKEQANLDVVQMRLLLLGNCTALQMINSREKQRSIVAVIKNHLLASRKRCATFSYKYSNTELGNYLLTTTTQKEKLLRSVNLSKEDTKPTEKQNTVLKQGINDIFSRESFCSFLQFPSESIQGFSGY